MELNIVPDAGHSAKEPGTTKLLTEVRVTVHYVRALIAITGSR
jgi:hypothetical protein